MASGIVILDDASGQITYSGGTWTLANDIQWYQASSNWPQFTDGVSHFGSFDLAFEGRSIAFIGNTPPNGLSQEATVSIDGGSTTTFDYDDPTPQTYMQWYQSPTLSDGRHRISIGHLAGTAIDMALITIGPNTSLSGKTLLVDDDDSQITYSGNWARNTKKFDAGTLPDGYPIRGSTHRSSNVGDSLTFRFTGTSASVYGIFNWGNTGSLTATYTLDGSTDTQEYTVNSDTPYHVSNFGEASNFVFFRTGSLPAGPHTLVITITQSDNVAYNFDYITYTPSFSNLASRPDLSSLPLPGSPSSSGSASNSPSGSSPQQTSNGGSSDSSASAVSPVSSGSSQSRTASNPNASQGSNASSGSSIAAGTQPGPTINGAALGVSDGERSQTPVGAIVGGVLGGLALVIFFFVLLFLRRRGRSNRQNSYVPPSDMRQTSSPISEQISPNSSTFSPGGNSSSSGLSPFHASPSMGHLAKGMQSYLPPLRPNTRSATDSNASQMGSSPGAPSDVGSSQHIMEVDAGPVTWPPAYYTIPGNARSRTSEAQNANPFNEKPAV
ncbi:hypothetical protein BJ165DRAFT_1365519 [Panaeolus papilionaceus]|nr:hypothetical protein BJ165DRAFT_1365519 [Panaeolus papilionaceus]